jgi:hypothetical protein
MSLLQKAAKELGNEENSSWVTKQLKKALDPKDRDTIEVQPGLRFHIIPHCPLHLAALSSKSMS